MWPYNELKIFNFDMSTVAYLPTLGCENMALWDISKCPPPDQKSHKLSIVDSANSV